MSRGSFEPDTAPWEPPISSLDDPRLIINRDMSFLEFQKRVLEGILNSNLDEFYL